MKEDNFFWKYKYEPGKVLKGNQIQNSKIMPLVSIITSYYNANEFMWQTINCVLNQTFQSWEWIIVDDGSTNKEALDYLKEVEKIDSRIKIYHKQNEGLALGRDYAIQKTRTNYILPLDADDLIEPTFIETLYLSLKTNEKATWAFTNSVGFGKYIYLSDEIFDSDVMKINNQITATALILKSEILKLGGYSKAKRYVNEDWHLWLRMLANNCFPVQLGYYGFWYRRQKESLLTAINDEKKQENKLRLDDLKNEADKIKSKVVPVVYPKKEDIKKLFKSEICKFNKNISILNSKKTGNLYILPYLGTDKKMYKKIKEDSKQNQVYIVTLESSEYSSYYYRQKYEEFAIVYDLTSFLNKDYWLDFIDYVIGSRIIKNIYLSPNKYTKEIEEEFDIVKIEQCKINKVFYNYKILKYKFSNLFVIRGLRKIARSVFKLKRKDC